MRFSLIFVFIVSCQSGPDVKEKPKLDDQERMELKQKQDAMRGSHARLRRFYREKRYRSLLMEAAKLLSVDEYDLKALCALGLYHMDRREYGASRIFFEKALKKHPDQAGLYNNIGVILLKEDNLESALLSFRKAYDIESTNPMVQANLGSIYVKYMDYVEAESLVQEVYTQMPNNTIVANNFAIVLRTQGEYEAAAGVYKKILSRDTRNIPTNLNYAILLVEYMKKYEEAQPIINKLEFLNPKGKYILAKIRDLKNKVVSRK